MLEQPAEVGIVAGVVDDEAGVDGDAAPARLDRDGVRVAAEPVGALEQPHVVVFGQRVRRSHSGDAGADHRDPHEVVCPARVNRSGRRARPGVCS